MTKKNLWLGIPAVMLVFAMVFVGCKNDSTDDDDNGKGGNGTLTINNIPADLNGKYVLVSGFGDETYLFGFQSKSAGVYTLCLISNGSVSMPTWTAGDDSGDNAIRYSGNNAIRCEGYIFESKTVTIETADSFMVGKFRSKESVTFKNGSATMSWSNVDYSPADDDDDNPPPGPPNG